MKYTYLIKMEHLLPDAVVMLKTQSVLLAYVYLKSLSILF